ncbi:MAG TPA: hypothetical protein VJI46_07260 [Candidatus Nanoarchaeia archaeon]|nr:hypothetical protein [Candidatus Nanoarchaeia archaeon]
MLRYLKKLFRNEEARKLSLNELKAFAREREESQKNFISREIRNAFGNIHGECIEIRNAIRELKEAELQNKNIPPKAVSIMEGNRSAYIKKVELFLKFLEGGDYESIEHRFGEELVQFGKSTIRPYSVLQEFFAHESANVSRHIRKIDACMAALRAVRSEGKLERIQKLAEKINDLEKHYGQNMRIKNELSESESIRASLLQSLSQAERQLSAEKESDSYREFLETQRNLEVMEHKKMGRESELVQHFSVLERGLRKLSKSGDQKPISYYIEDPVNALKSDKELFIIEILSRLNREVEDLDLKDRKKGKTLQEISFLSFDYLKSFLDELSAIENKIELLKTSIGKHEYFNKAQKLQKETEDLRASLRDCEASIRRLDDELGVPKGSSIRQEINELLKEEKIMLI